MSRLVSLSSALIVVLLAGAGSAFAQSGGTITGKVDATPPKMLPDTVVYLKNVPGNYPPKTLNEDQKGMKFIPHILTATVGDTVEFLNHDNVAHNVYSPDNEGFNLGTFKQNEKRSQKFDQAGTYTLLCSIHPEMLGYIFVGQNPYSAAVDAKGDYTIRGVPPGTYQLEVWNPKLKAAPKSVTVTAGGKVSENISIKR